MQSGSIRSIAAAGDVLAVVTIRAPEQPARLLVYKRASASSWQLLGVGVDLPQAGPPTALATDGVLVATARAPAPGTLGDEVVLWEIKATGPVMVQRFGSPRGEPGDQFGASLAIEGARLAIGSPGASTSSDVEDNVEAGAGAAYHYVRTPFGFQPRAALRGADGGDALGSRVGLGNSGPPESRDLLYVAAPFAGTDDNGSNDNGFVCAVHP